MLPRVHEELTLLTVRRKVLKGQTGRRERKYKRKYERKERKETRQKI
jgi:hypothetical protein